MLNRILNLVGVGRVSLVDDKGSTQLLQVDQGRAEDGSRRVTDKVSFIGRFGFSSSPPAKADLILLRLGGDRSQTVAIGSNDQASRPRDLGPGDSMMYDIRGAHIWLKDGSIEIEAKGQDIVIQGAGTVTVKAATKIRFETATLEVTGDIVSRADGTPVSMNALRDAYHAHKHTGVQTGTGSTSITDHDA